MKTTKHRTLLLVKGKGAVRAKDLVQEFDYSPATARSYLSYLTKQDLLGRLLSGHVLTKKGEDRLHFFEIMGCPNPDCSRCEGKAGYLTCPTCGHRIPRKKARISKGWDTPFFRWKAGVHCSFCGGLILSTEQAQTERSSNENKSVLLKFLDELLEGKA
jgi:hypothetical protein